MLKELAVLALAGMVASSLGFSERLKGGVALPPQAPVSPGNWTGGEGADGGSWAEDRDTPWLGSTADYFLVGHKRKHKAHKGREGGEGGEGGEGRKGRGPVHFVPIAPLHGAALPALRLECGSREFISTILGAGAGGFLGSKIGGGTGQLAAVAAGTLLGAFVGREFGAALDAGDVACAQASLNRAHRVPVGSDIVWNNPQSGHSGTIRPLREGTGASGQYCREYQTTVTVGGRTEQSFGQACRQPDGAWRIVK